MDDLRDFNEAKLYKKLFLPEDQFETFLQDAFLLHRERICDKCNSSMTLKSHVGKNHLVWRCNKRVEGKKCGRELGYLVGMWFEGSHLTLKEIFQLSFYFCRQTHTHELIQIDMERDGGDTLGEHAVCDWMEFYREVRL